MVAGVGSPHGADRLGWAVIDHLSERQLPCAAKLVRCGLPTELSSLLLAHPNAILIDAMLGRGPAGTIHCLRAGDLPQATLRLSSHGVGLVDAVLLASALGYAEEGLRVLVLDVVEYEASLAEEWVVALADAVVAQLSVK